MQLGMGPCSQLALWCPFCPCPVQASWAEEMQAEQRWLTQECQELWFPIAWLTEELEEWQDQVGAGQR